MSIVAALQISLVQCVTYIFDNQSTLVETTYNIMDTWTSLVYTVVFNA